MPVDFETMQVSRLWNQKLPAWRPMFTPSHVVIALVVGGPVFIALGVLIMAASNEVVEQGPIRYDNLDGCAAALKKSPCSRHDPAVSPGSAGYVPQDPLCWRNVTNQAAIENECHVVLNIAEDMKAPVYFYYEIRRFYQNQRVYVKSQASTQLKGGKDTWQSLDKYRNYLDTQCVQSGFDKCKTGAVKVPGKDSYFCNPCGLVARSFFTDEFEIADANGAELAGSNWTQEGVAWPRDKEEKFRPTDVSNRFNVRTAEEDALVTDPGFMVWMRTAALPEFRKLYRVVNRDLKKGQTFTIKVRNNYDVSSFGGEKLFVLSTMSWLGGKNEFLAGIYIGVGGLCLFLAAVFGTLEKLQRGTARP
jgi:hypothetical protein